MSKSMKEWWAGSAYLGDNISYLDHEAQAHEDAQAYFLALAQQPEQVEMIVEGDALQVSQEAKVARLVEAYRAHGHLKAKLDPLNLLPRHFSESLSLSTYGLSTTDLNTEFHFNGLTNGKKETLKAILEKLESIYSCSLGVEYKHISNTLEVNWLEEQFEQRRFRETISPVEQKQILSDLVAADELEKYLDRKYKGKKRFSLEGGDALIPLMKTLVDRHAGVALQEVVVGMAHRGRLNVLINVLGKKAEDLFLEFEDRAASNQAYSGDVKYHMGFSSDIRAASGQNVHLVLAFNPSHLEIVNGVVLGSARARLRRRKELKDLRDLPVQEVLPILIHGDAAFAGQGVIMETFNMSNARGFRVGGTIHLVINNQVGFTTNNPLDSRSTLYCTDIAKMVQAPVIHVNGNDPEAVVFAAKVAMEYRQKFSKDIVIDMVCYRRRGHNEGDEPSGTQPLMYKVINELKVLKDLYAERLIAAGVLSKSEFEALIANYNAKLDKGEAVVATTDDQAIKPFANDWSLHKTDDWRENISTTVTMETLKNLSVQLSTMPEGFVLQKQVAKAVEDRLLMAEGKLPLNWGYGETMAYATLLNEGYSVRLCGQDSGRGTFAHRHASLHDYNTGKVYTPLQHVGHHAKFIVIDSLLSEEGVLAFEYGFSTSEPEGLALWEGQFGDFVNGAQVVIDQFISAGEQKWGRLCGLVLLLPHGWEGMGPEHSSARLERFLQLCAQENMQVCTPTTPAQMFHLLRRQMIRKIRKPLIVMTPKSLLRHKLAVSTLDDLTKGRFELVMADNKPAKAIKRLVLCGGKVYYDLFEKREALKRDDVALVRVEQLYPFPDQELSALLKPYASVTDIVWCQEEPKNQGAWNFIRDELSVVLNDKQKLSYAGRPAAAAPAVGSPERHNAEVAAFLEQVFSK